MSIPEDLIVELKRAQVGDVRTDLTTRLLYSTDASIYQIEPLGVVFPRQLDDLPAIVEIAASYQVPVLARGAGSSLAGQAIGQALIIDCSRYLNKIEEINPQAGTAVVQPGLVLNTLNQAASAYGLQFGPDPASAERATLGGSLANNATGAHSILYGMASDHLLEAEVVLSDGSMANFREVPLATAVYKAESNSTVEGSFYRAALEIRQKYGDQIRQRWPETWRRASGYNLHVLLPWSPSEPPRWSAGWNSARLPYPPVSPGTLNLAPLVAGSEGTLAVIRRASVRLVPRPKYTILGVLAFDHIADACDATPGLLDLGPSAVELIPRMISRLARGLPAYAHQLAFLDLLAGPDGQLPDLLVVEFSGEDRSAIRAQAEKLGSKAFIAEDPILQQKVWFVRKVGLGILQSRPGDQQAVSFIEDLSVPVHRLGDFVRGMYQILDAHNTSAEFYAHASAGCLHIRPLVSQKSNTGMDQLLSLAAEAVDLTVRLGGAVSGEHGDGIARTGWIERAYGDEISAAFRLLKSAADPRNLLNPGKITSPDPDHGLLHMDENLRYGLEYHAEVWQPVLDFTRQGGAQGKQGLIGAIEQCNGAGVCRKADGVMCPSFQVTQEEMHSTRGRANLLRALISGRFPTEKLGERAVKEALDLCLACKGCQAECPSAVDMARLKYEFIHRYFQPGSGRRRPWRDYLFGYIGVFGRLGQPFAPLANALLGSQFFSRAGEKWLGLSSQRSLPRLARRTLQSEIRHRKNGKAASQNSPGESVLFLSDAFTEFFHPEEGLEAIDVLGEAGCRVIVIPVIGSGRTLLSKGFLPAAKRQIHALVDAISKLDPDERMAVVGVEPSEIYTLRDEALDLLPGDDRVIGIARRAYMIDEFLLRPGPDVGRRLERLSSVSGRQGAGRDVLLHGHCYQKAQPPADDGYPTGLSATVEMLSAAGYRVKIIDSSCCGMAGAFGYEAEHYKVSMQVGELGLLPAVREAGIDWIVAASGVSCQAQIQDGTGRKPVHPVGLLKS